MDFEHVLVGRSGQFTTITMNRPERRNALSCAHLDELTTAFGEAGNSDARGVILAGAGAVFSAGHDFGEVAAADLDGVRRLLRSCGQLIATMQSIPQPVIARVQALATAAGCQLVAAADLAVAADSAEFAVPGGMGGWFCHTPMVTVGRAVGRKRAFELAFTGDRIDASTALAWGLVNRVVPAAQLDAAVEELLGRATRGSAVSKGLGKAALYAQLGMSEGAAWEYALAVMAESSQTPDAKEAMAAFLHRR